MLTIIGLGEKDPEATIILNVNCPCVQRETQKKLEIFHLVDPRAKQRKQSSDLLNLKSVDCIK